MLIGGIAVIARGVPRLTRDVDATIDGASVKLEDLITWLGGVALVPRINDVLEFADANQVLLLRHEPSGVDVDVSIAWLAFELEAIAASDRLEIAGVRVHVARAEDLVIYKAVAFRPQDQQDIERLLTLHGATIDLARARRVVTEFATALDEPELCGQVAGIIRRVGLDASSGDGDSLMPSPILMLKALSYNRRERYRDSMRERYRSTAAM